MDKQTQNLMKNIKLKIKSDCKMILNMASSKDQQLKFVLDRILKDGYVTGSTLANHFLNLSNTNSDFDIFIEYDRKVFETLRSRLTNMSHIFKDISFVPVTGYDIIPFRENVKFTIGGSMSSIKLNIIFMNSIDDPDFLTSRFDFEVCNWHYNYEEDSLFVSERCIELLKSHELDFTDNLRHQISAYLKLEPMISNGHQISPTPPEIEYLTNRFENYLTRKGFVMSKGMRELVAQINATYGEIWIL